MRIKENSMSPLGGRPWWKDRENGWPYKGVRDFFDESKKYFLKGDISTAIEVLEWGKRFSSEFGSGGAVNRFDEMIEKLQRA
ncbi:MAG TPA: hypothetical protein VIJ61_10315 [Thermoanaerobaculia bacterium]